MNANDYARQRCEKLFSLARQMLGKDDGLAKRYVSLAKKIAMRHRIHLPKEYCKKCLTVRVEGKTVKTRLAKGTVEKTCLQCGEKTRRPFKTPQKKHK